MNKTKPRHVLTEMKRQIYFRKWIKFVTASKILWAGENCLFLIRISFLCSSKKRFHSGKSKFHSKVLMFDIFMVDKTWLQPVCVMLSNFTRYLHKSSLVVLWPKLSGNLKPNIEYKAWLIEILTNTYRTLLSTFVSFVISRRLLKYWFKPEHVETPLSLRDCVPGQGQLLQIVKARLWLAKKREWNGVFRQAGACGEERKDEPKSACGGG